MKIGPELKRVFEKQQYRIVGNHSLVKVCYWTKKSLSENRVCFKEKWYPPVESHRCMEITPYFGCNFNCLYCWRLHPGDRPNLKWKEFPLEKYDEPSDIIENAIEARKKLLSGFKGNPNVDKKKFEEALKPSMMTLSLTGEPTLYPKISELIKEGNKRNIITFLVTNGSMPNVLANLDPLPWQLYVSLSAPDKGTFVKTCRPLASGMWEKVNETLELFSSLDCRTVIRLTLVNGLNFFKPEKYAKLILKAEPKFIEAKSYSWIGESRKRLPSTAVIPLEKLKEFAQKIAEYTGYRIKDEDTASRVVLLSKK